MKNFYERNKSSVNQTLLFGGTLVAALLFLKFAMGIVAPFVLALILSVIISPPVDLLAGRLRLPRGLATFLSMLVILSGLGLLLNLAFRLLTVQLLSFSANFPHTFSNAMSIFKNFQDAFYDFFEIIPEDLRDIADQTITTGISSVTAWLGDGARKLSVSAVKIIPKTFVFILITIIATFFMTKDKQIITEFVARQTPGRVSDTILILKKDIFGALWGYVRAQMILMCFSGAISFVGLSVLGYEYALLFGLIIAVLDSLPIFGPGFILWPWAAVNFIYADYRFAVGLMIIYLIIMLCRQMLEPKVLSAQIGIYPLVTLFSLYVGLMALGPVGLIVGPVLAIIIKSLQGAGMLPNWK